MRGLVFGPIRGETEGFSSGKRPRVELGTAGRLGGSHTSGSRESTEERRVLQSREHMGEKACVSLVDGRGSMGLVIHEEPARLTGVIEDQ